MASFFGDGFDLYAATTDPYMAGTYWDSGNFAVVASAALIAGRFTGSRGLTGASSSAVALVKSSGANDNIHHINIAFQYNASLGAAGGLWYFTLSDSGTAQCTVAFGRDGAIFLTNGAVGGTVISFFPSAFTGNVWNGWEIEVVIHNTAGSWAIRKNGNTVNDFSATGLNTRGGTANNYANRLALGLNLIANNGLIDDFLWRSDASSVAWVGDIRCYTRMPASDASVQWTPSGAVVPVANYPDATNSNINLVNTPKYQPFLAPCDGTIATLSMQCVTAVTADIKCTIYASAAGVPTTVLGSANLVTNPGVGTTTWTFATPVAVSRGVSYYVAFCQSASSGSFAYILGTPTGGYAPLGNATAYASFPVANPTGLSAGNNYKVTINITPTTAPNGAFVADTQQDAAASYVSSSTVGQTDLYGIAPITVTPASVVGVTTRALAQKTDAGTRNIGVQLKSGSTTSNGTSTALNTSWSWVYRNDLVDPATGAAWSAVSVNNLQIGETVTA
jgi:hypothetical protein